MYPTYISPPTTAKDYRVEKDGGIWRLVFNSPGHSETEEVVTSVQEILCRKDLPPITERDQVRQSQSQGKGDT
jgi:hypothetical protein